MRKVARARAAHTPTQHSLQEHTLILGELMTARSIHEYMMAIYQPVLNALAVLKPPQPTLSLSLSLSLSLYIYIYIYSEYKY
jgi:hypothetical protein